VQQQLEPTLDAFSETIEQHKHDTSAKLEQVQSEFASFREEVQIKITALESRCDGCSSASGASNSFRWGPEKAQGVLISCTFVLEPRSTLEQRPHQLQ
jgi:hypothetical protein